MSSTVTSATPALHLPCTPHHRVPVRGPKGPPVPFFAGPSALTTTPARSQAGCEKGAMIAMEVGWFVVWAVAVGAAAWLVLVLSVAVTERWAKHHSSEERRVGSEDDAHRPVARAA